MPIRRVKFSLSKLFKGRACSKELTCEDHDHPQKYRKVIDVAFAAAIPCRLKAPRQISQSFVRGNRGLAERRMAMYLIAKWMEVSHTDFDLSVRADSL